MISSKYSKHGRNLLLGTASVFLLVACGGGSGGGGTNTGGNGDTGANAGGGSIPASDTSQIDSIWMDVITDETTRWLDIGSSGSYRIYGPVSVNETVSCTPVSGPFSITNIGDDLYEAHDGTVYRSDFDGQVLFKTVSDGEEIVVSFGRDRLADLNLCS